ncbi:DUF5107 domain-containing protein [uncultured Maribacter sp.]|uniref:DUF5107 domain-containing protein n=1 Tax=uncultured Maribacter sp. TaxID=431308 RepID=UPI00260A7995|nr:DUF5107 domain-containing protein [uncultured Maribacter sp.]
MKKTERNYFTFFALFILISTNSLFAQVRMTEESWTLPTYKVMPSEKAPMFFTNGNFQGAQRVIYPYAANDEISGERTTQDWKALILENEYIKLCVTPEIGGKLYYATDKTNDYNFIYKNNEVKPGNIGMTGAWVSGGIEWCVLHHHRASTFLPMDYDLVENKDGSKTIFIGETEPRHRMRWNVGVTVSPGKSYFEAEVSIYNPTPYTHNFLYWANVAAHTNNTYQTIFPPSVEFVTFHQKNQFTRWPISNDIYRGQDFTKGVDISRWKNVKEHASFFAHDLKEDFMGGYDHGKNSGTVHIGDHNIVKGAKLWEWGSGKVGQATEGRLTETSGPYVEIMVGAFSDNQPDYTWIRPYEVKKWKQYWYPVKDIEGFKNANLNAAVNLEQRQNNTIFLGYHSTQKVKNARIILKNGNQVILEKNLLISPEKAFTEKVKINSDYKFTELYTELRDLDTNAIIISYQPKKPKNTKNLPPVVTPPAAPEDITSVEELFIVGNRMEQFYKTANGGETPYYKEALKRDPNHTKTNIAIGNKLLKNGDYTTARTYFSRAIKRQTNNYTRPSNGEGLYLQGITLKKLELYEEAIDTLYRATWDNAYFSAAFFELAQISSINKDYKKALKEINEAISSNTKNTRLYGLKSAIQRKLGNYNNALETLQQVSTIDPLNFRIQNELYLTAKETNKEQEASNLLASLNKKMRDFEQNYIELAVEYLNDGMLKESEEVLKRYKGKNPISIYYLGYIQDKFKNKDAAKKLFSEAQSLSEEGIFPYRLETIEVLKKAIEYNPKDGKAYYYLGNILYDKQPEKAILHWENAVKKAPKLAMAHRNIGFGYYRHYKDYPKAILSYEKAIALDKTDAVFYNELDVLYELNNSPVKKRLAIFEGNNKYVKNRDDAFVRQMQVLTLAGQADKVVAYLKDKTFSYREGTSRVRENIIDAQLSLGIKFYKAKNYEKALEHFLLAQVPDEAAGRAKFGNREIQVNYFIGLAYEALNKTSDAKRFYTLSTNVESVKNITQRSGFMSYYEGLSFLKLGNKTKANEIFNSLVANGEKQLNFNSDENSYFQIFGEKDSENTKKSLAYTMRGLGYKGLNKKKQAKEDLKKAIQISVSNLWAGIELE